MEILLSLVALFGALTNVLGVDDLVRTALREVRDRSSNAYIRFRVWLAAKIAGPLAWFMWVCAAGMIAIFSLATYIHVEVWGLGFRDGQYPLFCYTTILSVFGITVWAFYQRRVGRRYLYDENGQVRMQPVLEDLPEDHVGPPQQIGETEVEAPTFQPGRVSFFLSGFLLTVGMVAESVTLGFHALAIESRGLWLTAMVTRYLGIVVIAVVMSVLAWIVRRGGGAFEKLLQFAFETVTPIVPGITFQNVRERLFPNGLNLLEEEADARKIAAVAIGLFMVVAPYDLILLIFPTNGAATYVVFPYVAAVFGGLMAARRVGLRARVAAAGDRFYWIIFQCVPIALLVVGAVSFFISKTRLGHGVEKQTRTAYEKAVGAVESADPWSPSRSRAVKLAPNDATGPAPVVVIPLSPVVVNTTVVQAKPPTRSASKKLHAPKPMSTQEAEDRVDQMIKARGLSIPDD